MASGLPEDLEKAETIVEIMLEDWPGLLAVLALKLRLVLLRTPDDVDGYARILFKMIDVAHLTDSNFALVVGKIRSMVVKKNAVKQACECLDALIRSRLLPMERDDLLEKAFVTRIWATIQDRTCGDNKVVENLKVLLDVVAKQLKRPLGQKVTGSATGLLWKASEVFYMQHNYHASSKWCRLALHVVFDKSGELNIAKISR